MNTRPRQGFTIVEIIVVIVVLAILMGFVIVFFNNIQIQSRDTKRENDIEVLQAALQKYYDAKGEYPLACEFNGTSGAACSTWSTQYQTNVGSAPTSTLGASTTISGLQTLFPSLNATFGDPRRGSANTVNTLNTTGTQYISTKSYFYMTTNLASLTGTAYLATNDTASTNITCAFSPTGSNVAHNYVLGYFSESQNKWIFYQGPRLEKMNSLGWNSTSKAECTPVS